MPSYSISRTNQYSAVTSIQSAANQSNSFYTGSSSISYGTLFNATPTGICPATNLMYNYTTPDTPTSSNSWYPYSLNIAVCGGQPQGQAARAGYAYLKLWDSNGAYLMGNVVTTPTLTQQSAGTISDPISTNNIPVLATTQIINNARAVISTNVSNNYIAGYTTSTTATQWIIGARRVGQTGGNNRIYLDTTVGSSSSAISANTYYTSNSMLGFVSYSVAPVQPTSFSVTTTSNGISYTCQADESTSLVSASITTNGAVSSLFIFYSTTSGSGFSKVAPTSFVRTFSGIGVIYTYTGTLTTTLTVGQTYYFKVALINDACVAFNANAAGAISAEFGPVVFGYPVLFQIRNITNTGWSNVAVGIRDPTNSSWSHASVYKRDPTNTFWITGATQTSQVASMVSGSGSPLPSPITATTSGTAYGGFPPYTIVWARVSGPGVTVSYSGSPTSTATWSPTSSSTLTTIVQMTATDSIGQVASARTNVFWVI